MIDPTERVAIVGIGGVFPGASDPEHFWANIVARIDATTEVPPGRWSLDPADAFDPEVARADHVYAKRGGFVQDFQLDPEGLDLDPELLSRLDPMVQLALHTGRHAWREARTEGIDRSRVGVIFGNIVLPTETTSALAGEILGRTLEESLKALVGETGLERRATEPLNRFAAGLPAGLLAKGLGLGGGAYTLDAACASSLYALKLAADELLAGRADAMITGGLSRPDPLYTQMGFSQLRALSTDGRAYPFDERAGGLVVGEGAGMFVLKRLSDAVKQGDTIHGVIAAVGLSNDVDGGLLAPSSEGQLRAMRSAYEHAGWSPRDVDLVECHATGTPIGDAVEFQSLKMLWGEGNRDGGRCVIGSHKANIGHALTASGAAGLIKVLSALRHKILPPTPNFERPNAKLAYEESPFRVLNAPEPWRRRESGRPRRAAVSGFGFGGINAHALIEEWVPGSEGRAPGWIDPEREAEPEAIAIVGMSTHVGPFRGLRMFQERIFGGDVSERPASEKNDWGVQGSAWFRAEGFDGQETRGYHLDQLALRLDRFRIPPKELESMLPQQSLALLAAADAIADAGWDERPRLRAGVCLGVGLDPNTTNYHVRWSLLNRARVWNQELGLSEGELAAWTEELREACGPPLTANRTMGALGGLVASRVAREFRMGGPSFTISSEETSGLRALEVAVRLLRQGDLDEAVVGAVDLTGDPRNTVSASRAGVKGLTRADGAAALVLKRLDDALRDGDRIYALIRGIGGATGGEIDAKSSDAGALSLAAQRALDEAGIEAGAAGYHVWSGSERQEAESRERLNDVGHAGAASGLLGLVKGALALYQEILPGDDAAGIGPRFWLHDRVLGPRRAEVSGAGVDANCIHVVLEEFQGEENPKAAFERVQPIGPNKTGLFALEGDDAEGLIERVEALKSLVESSPGHSIEALARRWWLRNPNDPSRRLGIGIVADSSAELRESLGEAARRIAGEIASGWREQRDDRLAYNSEPIGSGAEVAFVFPGIGNQFTGMGRGISARWPEVFRALDKETKYLRGQLALGAGWDSSDAPEFEDQRAPILGQVVLGTLVSDLLRLFGVKPDAMIGYSLGESSALFAARAWTERDAMQAKLNASPLFKTDLAGPCEAAGRAWKLAPGEPAEWVAGIVPYPAEDVRRAIVGISRVYLLIINTARECVIGGQRGAVERLVAGLGGAFLPLPVVSAVHCEVAKVVEAAYRELHTLTTTVPRGIRIYSAGWGRAYEPDEAKAADAVVAQALDTVDFPALIRRAYDDGVRVFLEIGPGASCTRMIRNILAGRPHVARAACVAKRDEASTVLEMLARLVAERVPVNLQVLYGRENDSPEIPARRMINVDVGGKAFNMPAPPPRPKRTSPRPLEEVLKTVTASPHHALTSEASASRNGSAAEAYRSALPADELTRSLIAAETSRGRAHEAFLRVSADLAQTMGNHLAFQMALIEAMSANPSTDEPWTAPLEDLATTHEAPSAAPALDRAQCMEFALGAIGNVLGPRFAPIDAYPTRVRLPGEPLMLVDRIIEIEGEALSMTGGRVVTEHDILPNAWYLDGGKIPTCIAVESGQADLFLSGYLGIDFITKGQAVYRLLDAVVIFHRDLPGPGEVIRYDIKIASFFRQGDTHLFRFHFDATVNGEPLMTMRDGCAGFFSEAELAAGKGVVHTKLDLRPLPGKRPEDWAPLVAMGVEAYDDQQINALRAGDYRKAFGPAFEGLGLSDPLRLPGGLMTLLHRVPHLDPSGGRFGLGLIRSELDIEPDAWFLTCHFIDDQVMPGTLMYECCLHALRVYLFRMGWVGESDGVAYEPVAGLASRLRCRGQVTASTQRAVFELAIKEIGYGPEPYAIADAMMYADGKAVVEVLDMSVRITGLSREDVERVWRDRRTTGEKPVLFTREQVLAFALGKPSEAFGDRYLPFDDQRVIARLPAPPYSFLDRVTKIVGAPWEMKAGASAEADYDVPTDAWYFEANRQERMPFAVLLEIPLQLCGWISSYIGSALTSEDDLAYRNLGGAGVLLADVTPDSGTLTSTATMTKVSRSGGMVIQHFDIETRAGDVPVYRGTTYFGFFLRDALLNQVGIREATLYQPTAEELSRAKSLEYPASIPFPDDRLRMIDRVETLILDGGPHGLGYLEGIKRVDPSAWFFKAHFHQDPVVPGSLGLESLLQLLKVLAVERWGTDPGSTVFEPIGLGDEHQWVYRGQVIPTDRVMTTQAVVTAVDDAGRWLKADGYVSVDGRVIYQMIDFTLRIAHA